MKRPWRRGTAALLLATMAACSAPAGELEEKGGALRPENPQPDDPSPDTPKGQREVLDAMELGLMARHEYLSRKYENERGQSDTYKKTLYAALLDIQQAAARNGYTWEYCTLLYQDRYKHWYYLAPVTQMSDSQCEVSSSWIQRPDTKPVGNGHTHPRRQPHAGGGGDNETAADLMKRFPCVSTDHNGKCQGWQYWTVTPNGDAFFHELEGEFAKPKFYGKIDKGHIITGFNSIEETRIPGFDPYNRGDDSSWLEDAWKVAAGVIVATGGAIVALLGGASTQHDGCCYGPPATGYDPASDPTQVCRRSDGGDCS